MKNLINGTLKLTILQSWSKFWTTIENGHFRVGRRAIFRQRSKFFKFRKKRLLRLTELYHILES